MSVTGGRLGTTGQVPDRTAAGDPGGRTATIAHSVLSIDKSAQTEADPPGQRSYSAPTQLVLSQLS